MEQKYGISGNQIVCKNSVGPDQILEEFNLVWMFALIFSKYFSSLVILNKFRGYTKLKNYSMSSS